METTLKDRFLEYFSFFLQLNIIRPSNGLPASLPNLWALHCMVQRPSSLFLRPIFQLLFCPFPAPITTHKQPSSLPPLSSGQSQCLGTSQPRSFTCPFSSVTPPGLSHQDAEARVFLMMVCWESCTPTLRSGHLQPRRKVMCQVRQKCSHNLWSQEGSGRTRHPALWPDSYCKIHKNQEISRDCLISMETVFSDVRTALSMIPLFFNHH